MTKRNSKTKHKPIVDKYYIHLHDVYIVVANKYVDIKQIKRKYIFCDNTEIDDRILDGCATTSKCKDRKTNATVILVKYNGLSSNKELDFALDFINTISHEATHVALDIYEKIDQNVCFCTPEPFCYLLGYATECIYKTLIKNE